MDRISEIQTQTISRFKDPIFACNFAVDNNPQGIFNKLTEMGYGNSLTGSLISDKAIAKQLILHWYNNKQTSDILELLNSVNYINEGGNALPYTQGFIDYFRENTNPAGVGENAYGRVNADGMKFSWDGLLSALGAGLTTYGAITSGGGMSNGEPTQAQLEAEQAQKKKQMWTIIAWVIGSLAVLALIVISIKYFKKK